jgi:hypothetical protein
MQVKKDPSMKTIPQKVVKTYQQEVQYVTTNKVAPALQEMINEIDNDDGAYEA